MDYIEINKAYFKQFLPYGKIDSYIEWKRKDAAWGDHLEIQAMMEIYQRGVKIYGYSTTPLRVLQGKNPMRVQYENGNHYNSIKVLGKENLSYTTEEFGVIE